MISQPFGWQLSDSAPRSSRTDHAPTGSDHRRVRVTAALVAALVALATPLSCGSDGGPAKHLIDGFEQDWFRVSPSPARQGEPATVEFLRPTRRGVDYELYRRSGTRWQLYYIVIVKRIADELPLEARAVRADRIPDNFGIPDSIFSEPVPDVVQLPVDLGQGDFMLCTDVSPLTLPPQWRTACATLVVAN
jgi:hypothetical protein